MRNKEMTRDYEVIIMSKTKLKTTRKEILLSFLATLLTSLFPVLFLLLNNIGNVRFTEILLPIVVSGIVGIVIWLIFSALFHSFVDGSICGCLVCLIGFNFRLIENVLNSIWSTIKYWHLLPVSFFVITLLMILILSKLNFDVRKDVNLIFVIVFGLLIIFNFLQAIPKFVSFYNTKDTSLQNSEMSEYLNSEVPADLPNIYWLIFDEYSNFDVLEKYFDYNNYEFASFLEKNNFTVSYNSINESQQTMTILSNYVYLDYITDDSVAYSERQEIMKNGSIFKLLEENGYTINAILGGENFGLLDKKVSSTTMEGDDFATLIMKNTVIYPFFVKDTYKNAQIYLTAFDNLQKIKVNDNESPTLHFAYFNLPHQPFCFDANGNKVPLSHINDWVDQKYYLNQLIYTTTQIQETIESILKEDKDAIIILQSDHSARSLQTEDGEYLIEKFDRRHFLNAIYFKGQPLDDIKGKSGVNTLRIVLEKLLSIELPELEVPISEYEF